MSDEPFLLQQAYVLAFTNKQVFVANNFPLCDNLTELIDKGIIKDEYRTSIASCESSEKGKMLMSYLLKEKDVVAFDNLIQLCDEKNIRIENTKLADCIKQEINNQKRIVGLPSKGI